MAKTELTAGQYNAKARDEGREDWNIAYRKDILGIDDSAASNNNVKNKAPVVINNQEKNSPVVVDNGEAQKKPSITSEQIQSFAKDSEKFGGFQSEEYKNNINQKFGDGAYDKLVSRLNEEQQDIKQDNLDNWNVEKWKAAGSNKQNLIDAIENKYKTVVESKKNEFGEDIYTANIGDDIYEWNIDKEGNPIKKKIGSVGEEEKIKNGFVDLINSGARIDELNNYITNNQKYKGDLDAFLRQHLKQADQNSYLSIYSGMDNESLYNEYLAGNIVPGSDKYNLLPEEQRKSFESWKSEKETALVLEKSNFDGINNNVLNFDDMLASVQTFFAGDLKSKYEDLVNSPDIKNAENKIFDYQRQIEEVDEQIKKMEKELPKMMPGTPDWLVAAELETKAEAFIDKKNRLLREMGIETARVQNMKDDAKYQIELAKYDDNRNKEAFMLTLNQYNTERSRMDQFKILEFQEQSKIQAENRAREFQLKMQDIQQRFQIEQTAEARKYESGKITEAREYEAKNQKGVYQTDRDGNLLYLVNGVAEKVLDSSGEIVGITKEKGYSDSIIKNELGGWDILRVYDDGRTPDMFSYGVDGKTLNGTSMYVWDALSSMPEVGKYFNGKSGALQCGEAANIYLKNIGVNDIRMGNSYDSKKQHINSQSPQVGGLAIWNPNGAAKENGHVGMVTGYNPATGMVEVTDWNSKGDGMRDTYKIPASQIINSDGGFVHLAVQGASGSNISTGGAGDYSLYKDIKYTPERVVDYKAYNNENMSATEIKYLQNNGLWEQFQAEAQDYGKYQAALGLDTINDYIEDLEKLKNNPIGKFDFMYANGVGDLGSMLERIKNNEAFNKLLELKNGGATFGALSDSEFRNIASTSLAGDLGYWTSESRWGEIIDKLLREANKVKTGIEVNNPYIGNEFNNSGGNSILDLLNEYEKHSMSGVGSVSYAGAYDEILNR